MWTPNQNHASQQRLDKTTSNTKKKEKRYDAYLPAQRDHKENVLFLPGVGESHKWVLNKWKSLSPIDK